MNHLPLSGIRIADFTQVWAGPFNTLWLGILGAEVIKIESQKRPDPWRLPTPGANVTAQLGLNKAPGFVGIDFGKLSCTINLTTQKGVALAKELVRISDIVTENFSAEVMDRFGLAYENLQKVKSDLIMLSTTGMGHAGPFRNFLAYGPAVHSFTSLTTATGYPEGPPQPTAGGWSDILSAEMATFTLLSALHQREKTGQGQYIDLSMSEVMASMIPESIMDYTMNQRLAERVGNRDEIMAPHNCYRCQGDDKWVAIAVTGEEEWQALCQVVGHPEWTQEARFADPVSRWQNQGELDPLITQWTKERTAYEAAELLQKAGVPAGPTLHFGEVINEPHLKARGFYVETDHPELGKGLLCRMPWRNEDGYQGRYETAPLLGEHNDYVFGQLLGLSEKELAQLKEEMVIY